VSGRQGPVGVAVVGAGLISKQYLANLTSFPDLRVHVVADLVPEAAAVRAEEFGVPDHGPVAVAMEHPDVEVVVNLTVPAAHLEVGMAAVAAGRHVWNEKPLATDLAGARSLLSAAADAGVRVGGAPDTFLGSGLQAALRQIAAGVVGDPRSALFLFQSRGPEAWHPNPEFLFAPGGGPLYDMGPYYLTLLIQALGPVVEVSAVGGRAHAQRQIRSGPKAGTVFDVTVPTHVGVLLRFADGRSAQGVLSFDSPRRRTGFVEVSGTEATMSLPDPNMFDGTVEVWPAGSDEPESTVIEPAKAGRGIGVLDMARAIRAGEPHRATGDLAYHVLDVLCAVEESMNAAGVVAIGSRVPSADPLPAGWDPFAATL
jgi:predicted dehydrogenase